MISFKEMLMIYQMSKLKKENYFKSGARIAYIVAESFFNR